MAPAPSWGLTAGRVRWYVSHGRAPPGASAAGEVGYAGACTCVPRLCGGVPPRARGRRELCRCGATSFRCPPAREGQEESTQKKAPRSRGKSEGHTLTDDRLQAMSRPRQHWHRRSVVHETAEAINGRGRGCTVAAPWSTLRPSLPPRPGTTIHSERIKV